MDNNELYNALSGIDEKYIYHVPRSFRIFRRSLNVKKQKEQAFYLLSAVELSLPLLSCVLSETGFLIKNPIFQTNPPM